MTTQEVKRKLAAIFSADVKGYCRLMGEDEKWTVLYSMKREYEKALAEGERAVALNPNGAHVHVWYALSLISAGRPEEALRKAGLN